DRRVQVAAGQSVDVPLTLPDTPGTQEFRITATSQGAGGSATTLVIRLTVTVHGQGATPGDDGNGGDNGGDEGENGNGKGNGRDNGNRGAVTVRVTLRGDKGAEVSGARDPVMLAPGEPLLVVIRDGAKQDHEGLVVAPGGTVEEPHFSIGPGKKSRQHTATVSFSQPGQYTVQVHDPLHPQEATEITVTVQQQTGAATRQSSGRRWFLVDWDRWWAELWGRLAA
ncbi:MAG TPA: penicillin-binding protein, partial [Thermaerobacter sp.]